MKKIVALFVVALAIGCSQQETPGAPLPPETTEAGVPVANAPPRTAFHRNPFGEAFQADNLFVDGDFELTGRSDQAPWIAINQTQITLNYDTGGRCRSGVRCGVIGVGDALVGNMATPKTDDLTISVYVKPETQRCADADVLTIDLGQNSQGATITSLTTAPDVDGWCHFSGKTANMAYEEPALYVTIAQAAKSTTLHVDEATALPASEVPVHGIFPPMIPPDAKVLARANAAAAWIRAHRKFGRTAPAGDPR
jgi:hypothetical protein